MPAEADDRSFTADIAAFYERYLVPLIFEPYADDLARRTAGAAPADVLEIACGTGVVTRALAAANPGSAIIATDLNAAMVTHAAQVGRAPGVVWRQADAMDLPFATGSFDVAVCQFSVMFFPDRVTAYREVRRVLRPGGLFLFNVWHGLADNEFADVVTAALGALHPADPPRFLARIPHGHGDRDEIEADLRAAGFTEWRFDDVEAISAADSAEIPALAYVQGTPLRNEVQARGLDPEEATAAAAAALRERFGAGPVEGRISAVVVSAA